MGLQALHPSFMPLKPGISLQSLNCHFNWPGNLEIARRNQISISIQDLSLVFSGLPIWTKWKFKACQEVLLVGCGNAGQKWAQPMLAYSNLWIAHLVVWTSSNSSSRPFWHSPAQCTKCTLLCLVWKRGMTIGSLESLTFQPPEDWLEVSTSCLHVQFPWLSWWHNYRKLMVPVLPSVNFLLASWISL